MIWSGLRGSNSSKSDRLVRCSCGCEDSGSLRIERRNIIRRVGENARYREHRGEVDRSSEQRPGGNIRRPTGEVGTDMPGRSGTCGLKAAVF